MGSFAEKRLRVTIAVNQKGVPFDDNKNNVAIIDGLRVITSIQAGNGNIAPTAKTMIYGVSKTIINAVNKIRWSVEESKLNFIQIDASGDGGATYTVAYVGMIQFAYPNFNSAPENILVIESTTALHHQLLPVDPISYSGEVDVASAIKQIAEKMNMRFENNGVAAKLSNSYLPQTALEQAKALCQAADVDLVIEFDTLSITPRGGERQINIPVLSPSTGLISYPTPTMFPGVSFRCLYDPAIKLKGIIEIKDSAIDSANGRWLVSGMTHYLECHMPGGRWFSDIDAINIGAIKVGN